jgi:uncharacterized protein
MKQRREMIFLFILAVVFLLQGALQAAEAPDPSSLKIEEQKGADWRKEREDFFRNHQRSPLSPQQKKNFKGLRYYPFNPRFVFTGQIDRIVLHVNNPEYYATFSTNKGTNKRYIRYGRFQFNVDEKAFSLEIFKSILSDLLFIPFKDLTSGKETYEGGRYIEAEILTGYRMVLDFNMAYHPSCVYNEKIVCVLPPKENTLGIKILAGERNLK